MNDRLTVRCFPPGAPRRLARAFGRGLAAFVGVVGLLFTVNGGAAEAPKELFEGVTRVKLPGQVGALAVYGPEAFTVVAAPLGDKGDAAAVIAAAPFGQGRIVCAAHPGYLDVGPMKEGETGRLMGQLLLWAGRIGPKPKKQLRLAFVDNKPLAEALAAGGFAVANVAPAGIADVLPRCDVLLVRPYKIPRRDVAKVLAFVKRGGGLVMADAAWIWASYDSAPGENLREHFAGNLVAREAGIVWADETVGGSDGLVDAPAAVSPLLTGPGALEYLKAHPAAGAGDADARQAARTLQLAMGSVSNDDTLILPVVRRACEAAGLPAEGRPVAVDDTSPLARMYVALETYRALNATPKSPVVSPYAAAFPGQPPAEAKAVETKVAVDTSRPRWHGTGLYARAGDVVEVIVPPRVAAAGRKGLSVRIGCHTDRLWHHDSWKRAPQVTKSVPVAAAVTKLTSGFGGLVYVEVPDGCPLGKVDVRIKGAVPAPRFVLGETTAEQWRTQRTLPGPWAELGSDKLVITIPAEAIRAYDDPEGLMRYWDACLDGCADLAMIPTERPSAERFVVDVQIAAGYLHSGYPIMGPVSTTAELIDLKTLRAKGNWGYYHELGHNHQQPEWTWEGLGEVTVNLFTMYLLDRLNPGAPYNEAMHPPSLAAMTAQFEKTGKLEGAFEQLMPYYQLKNAFGWQPFQKVFAEYRALPADQKPKTVQEKKDQWLIRFSKATNRNLGPFYDSWKIGVSESAKKAVSHLPEWKPPPKPGSAKAPS